MISPVPKVLGEARAIEPGAVLAAVRGMWGDPGAERDGDEIWLWLEHLSMDAPRTIAELARMAEALGRFNGAYLVDRPLPTQPWLNRERAWPYWLLWAAEGHAVVGDPARWASPLAR